MNVGLAAPFIFCRKQEEIDAICAFTTALEDLQGILGSSKFFVPQRAEKCEYLIFSYLKGQKSVNAGFAASSLVAAHLQRL